MKLLGSYINGNYSTEIYSNGTKIRETLNINDNKFIPEFPECMDVKITNYCDQNCPYCHEASSISGKHGDIMGAKFIDTLKPYTELAIGGGNVLAHLDLIPFLSKLKKKDIIANITINQKHFEENIKLISYLVSSDLIKGLGISLINITDKFLLLVKQFNNAVIHIINGIFSVSEIKKLHGNDLKVLILGYKEFRKGKDFYSQDIENNKLDTYSYLLEVISGFKVSSFDNLAIAQLNVKRLLSDKEWNEFYMGDDGQFTIYIDLVEEQFAKCSISEKRYDLKDDIVEMFNIIRMENK